MIERLTFLLAIAGYAGLTTTAALAALRSFPARFWHAVAIAIVAHVALVWAARYEWQFAAATRNGYFGFIIFHGALALIVASVFVAARTARTFVWLAFVIVSIGAIGAVFRYDVVAVYKIPVLALAVGGTIGLLRGFQLARRRALPG